MIRFTIPLRTISAANSREHWAAKARRVRSERAATHWAALEAGSKRWATKLLPCVVTLTRVGGRTLDTDNLPPSLKSVRDQLADLLGVDDADPRVEWRYVQRLATRTRGRVNWGVEVEIQPEVEV